MPRFNPSSYWLARHLLLARLRCSPFATISMKNFSATIDLGRFDCCAIRRGSHQIEFLFYMRNEAGRTQVEASATQQFGRQQRVVELFWPRNADDLKRYAQRALLLVQQTMIANQQALRAGEQIVVENPQLEL